MYVLLIVLLVLVLCGGIPAWHYRDTYGYGPPSLVGVLLIVLLVLLLLGIV